MAAIRDGAFQAGVRAVGFDILFAYSGNQFSHNFDVPFLAALRNEEGGLGPAEITEDPDGRYRHLTARYETVRDDALASLAGALVRRANAQSMGARCCWHRAVTSN